MSNQTPALIRFHTTMANYDAKASNWSNALYHLRIAQELCEDASVSRKDLRPGSLDMKP
jgi:hypothetical protein